ncbi:MAG: SDR family NAD(P)-dependent oxidoreductase [Verrucomicrobia bacterium]|jgi:3-oxoacyl-[acyl-carrier protein] reductase|nr:SDR family NAD(P)-dependent oxidoreductase [Verrucomicrobiota bacterium]
MPWNGKTAIITGANSGIGKAIAGAFAAVGLQLVIAGRRQEKNEEVARDLEKRYETGVLPFVCDVSREEECVDLVEKTASVFGRVDVMVNNAGMGAMGTRIADSDTELFDKVMRTNLYSAYWCSREAWKWMERNEPEDADALRGAILNIASVCGVDAWAGTGLYAASKHGMMGLTRALADEGVQPRIRAAAICPAMVATAMTGVAGSDYIDPADIATTTRYLLDLKAAAWPTEIIVNRRGAA